MPWQSPSHPEQSRLRAAMGPCSQEGQVTAKPPRSSLTQICLLGHGLTGSWDETDVLGVEVLSAGLDACPASCWSGLR